MYVRYFSERLLPNNHSSITMCKLIMRLRKYQARGIDVIGAPAIGDDFEINEYALQSHGG